MITLFDVTASRAAMSALVLAAGIALGAGEAEANEFHGGGTLGNFVGCESTGWSETIPVTARVVLDESGVHRLAIFSDGLSIHFRRNGVPNDEGWIPLMVTETSDISVVHAWSRWQVVRRLPNNFNMDSQFFNVRVRVSDFNVQFGCTAEITVSVHRI